MSNRVRGVAAQWSRPSGELVELDRWLLLPVAVGVVFAAIQSVHVFEMAALSRDPYYDAGQLGVILEAMVPLVLAVGIVFTGPWLQVRGYGRAERRRVVSWMTLVAALVGLLFAWALSHQFLLGLSFPHAGFVTTTNLIAGSLLGTVVGVYDVRSRRHRRAIEAERATVVQQRARLSVLNRVLRHNIRNDAAVVKGYTESLVERTSGEAAELAGSAAAKTGELVALGEKAREIERVVDVDADDLTALDLRETVEAVLESRDQRAADVTVAVEVPAGLRLVTSERVLFHVLEELLDNAAEHVDATPVRVRISATTTDDGWVDLVVADNGRGLPDHERESLQSGVETALDHGSGLGLWLVNWGVVAVDGELSFEESEWGGAAVHVRLPRDGPSFGRPDAALDAAPLMARTLQ